MRKLLLLLSLLLFITSGLFILISKYTKTVPETKNGFSTGYYGNDLLTSFTGILREMNITPQEKIDMKLSEGRYQLTELNTEDRNKLLNPAFGVFIEGDTKNLQSLVGKCVFISGQIDKKMLKDPASNNKPEESVYNILTVKNAVRKNFSDCGGYGNDNRPDTESTYIPRGMAEQGPKVLTGTIIRFPRVIPDIGPYDYAINLDQSYTLESNASGLLQKTQRMELSPKNNTIWVDFENNIGKRVEISAYELWGYAESKYFLVVKVKAL